MFGDDDIDGFCNTSRVFSAQNSLTTSLIAAPSGRAD
jgi:hypothetical protein